MSDATALLLVLIALYASDCVTFLHAHSTAFVSFAGAQFRIRLPSVLFGNRKGGLALLNPLPPLGTIHVAQPLPVSIGPRAVVAYISQSLTRAGRPRQAGTVYEYAGLESVTAQGRDVHVNHSRFVRCRTGHIATKLAALLDALRGLDEAGRASALRAHLTATLDTQALAARRRRFETATRPLRVMCNVLWFYLFAACPLIVARFGFSWLLAPLAATGLAIHVAALCLFVRAHRRLLPASGTERVEHVVKMALCPPMLIRAVDAVAADLLDAFHPLALALVLCEPQAGRTYTEQFVRDLAFPVPDEPHTVVAEQTIDWFRNCSLEVLAEFLTRHQIVVSEILEPPADAVPEHRSYCPRCHGLYTVAEGECVDCFGVALRALPEADPKP